VWGIEYGEEREYLHVYIGHIRSKIEKDPKDPKYIITIPRVGHRFDSAKY
jgi:two-component system KDP operon response regulator KdpE